MFRALKERFIYFGENIFANKQIQNLTFVASGNPFEVRKIWNPVNFVPVPYRSVIGFQRKM